MAFDTVPCVGKNAGAGSRRSCGGMSDQRYDAMRHAVDLARTGQFSNWWSVAARLRAKRYEQADLDWTQSQREWLDRLCAEARIVSLTTDRWRPFG